MGLTILQSNIRNWKKNKYLLSVSLADSNPDVILLNETGINNEDRIKLYGYRAIEKNIEAFSGVAILIKNHIEYQEIYLKETNILAIKMSTTFGPIIISTAYVPPRIQTLPRLSLQKLLNFNLPTLFIGDLNAHHPFFNNSDITHPYGDRRGKDLYNLIQS